MLKSRFCNFWFDIGLNWCFKCRQTKNCSDFSAQSFHYERECEKYLNCLYIVYPAPISFFHFTTTQNHVDFKFYCMSKWWWGFHKSNFTVQFLSCDLYMHFNLTLFTSANSQEFVNVKKKMQKSCWFYFLHFLFGNPMLFRKRCTETCASCMDLRKIILI